jgi:hypothetical protein
LTLLPGLQKYRGVLVDAVIVSQNCTYRPRYELLGPSSFFLGGIVFCNYE